LILNSLWGLFTFCIQFIHYKLGSHFSRSSRDSLGFAGFKFKFPGVPQNSVRDAKCPGVLQVIKIISENVYERFDFPTVGESICRSRTATNRPLRGRNRKEKERKLCRLVTVETGL
jgi:hypothetical protein